MANPKKIASKGSALTCDEYDNNLDILQNRANHVGEMSCNNISDLDTCLDTTSVVTDIKSDISANTNRIVQIEADLSASGGVIQDINNLEATLRADITQNTNDIQSLENRLDNDILTDIASNSSQINSVSNSLNNNIDGIKDRTDAIELWRTTDEPKIDNSITEINTIKNTTIPAETLARTNADNALRRRIDTESQNRITENIRIEGLISDEVSDREQDVNTVDAKYKLVTDGLVRDLDNEIDDRTDADSLLQAQINNLNSGLRGAIPTGCIIAYAGTTAPPGFLMCRGGTVSRRTYSALFSVISTRYGNPSTSNFNLPDLRYRIPYGSNNISLNSVDPYPFTNTKVISESQMPRHSHRVDQADHQHVIDTTHTHGLFIHAHQHSVSNIPEHSHSLNPFRSVALGGGSEDDLGGELTAVASDDNNVYPKTSLNSPIGGQTTNNLAIQIGKNAPTTGNNETDVAGGPTVTSPSKSAAQDTSSRGGTGAFDVRQAAVHLNFIIKT